MKTLINAQRILSAANIFKFLSLLSCLLILTACTVAPHTVVHHPVISTAVDTNIPLTTGWRTVRFQLAWLPDKEPDWYIDTMIAGEVIAPLISRGAGQQLKLWRVHRRAKNDVTGHAFSFIFYTNTAYAKRIYAEIRTHALVSQWQREGRIKQLQFDSLQRNNQPEIKDTSDKTWPPAIQKTWPVYIMGASQMWLELISEIKSTHKNEQPLELRYQNIHQEITQLWETHGQHAWLHHLNALYSYSPIAMHF